MLNGVSVGTRPSDERREVLNESISIPSVSNFFPIERYYDGAETLYESVLQLRDGLINKKKKNGNKSKINDYDHLDYLYVYCKRYCMFVLTAIPEHNYYKLKKYNALRNKHTKQAQQLLDVLEEVAVEMDEQEAARLEELAKQRAAQEKKQMEQFENFQKQFQLQQQKSNNSITATSTSSNVQQSALDKLKLLQPPQQPSATTDTTATATSSTRYRFIDSSSEDEDDDATTQVISNSGGIVPLPPPLLPPTGDTSTTTTTATPNAPPSYNAVVHRSNKYHPFFGPSYNQNDKDDTTFTIRPPDDNDDALASTFDQQQSKKRKSKKHKLPKQFVPMRQQQDMYRTMYHKYQQSGRIQIYPLDTYQGRVSASTNGCTVISALVAATHLNNKSSAPISNNQIVQVIDNTCCTYLSQIRKKLGLGSGALIIPSDVHDHLVDAKILHQEYFVGAAGGNVMDSNHYGEFLKLLEHGKETDSNGKAAATFFFREHVISIVKYRDISNGNQYCYDWIDSLPTLNNRATRTKCTDINALEVLLLWYSSRKFSTSNCDYIDKNTWDDSMADLDPRVFQGFVWST